MASVFDKINKKAEKAADQGAKAKKQYNATKKATTKKKYQEKQEKKAKAKAKSKKSTSKNLTSNEALLLQNLTRTGTPNVVKQGTKNAAKTLRTSKAKTDDYKNLSKKTEKSKSKPSKTLSSNESLLLQNLTRTGTSDVVNKGLKGAEKTLRTSKAKTDEYKNLNKKVAKQDEKFLNSSPFAYGFMAGTSPIPLKETLEKQTGQKIDTSKAEKSIGYKAGYMTGLAAEYATTGGIARDAVQQGIKTALKQAGKKAGKEAAEKVTEKGAKEVAKNSAKLTEIGKRVLSGAAADTITGVPTNALEAGKEASEASKGEKGKTFAKSMAVNTAFDVGMGVAGEGVSAVVKAIKKSAAEKAAAKTAAETVTETAEAVTKRTKAPRVQSVKERLAAIREARAEVPQAPANASSIVKKAEQRKIQQVAEAKSGNVDKAWDEINEAKAYLDSAKEEYSRIREERINSLEDYIKNYEKKGSRRDWVMLDHDYGQGYYIPQSYSLNDKWYSEYYKVNGKPPAKKEARGLAKKLVDEGTVYKDSEFFDEELYNLKQTIDNEETIYRSLAHSNDLTDEQLAELAGRFTDKGLGKRVIDRSALERDLGADINRNKPVYKESTAAVNEVRPEGEKVMYETETHARREQAAKDRLAVDYDGEYKDLMSKDEYTSEDLATMGELLNREKTNFSRFHKLTQKAGEVSSRKGQELEAVKHIKENTVAGKTIKAEQASQKSVKKMKEENPRKLEQTDTQAKETIKEINKAVNAATDETLQDIRKLANVQTADTQTLALRAAIEETIEDILSMQETLKIMPRAAKQRTGKNVLTQYKEGAGKKIAKKLAGAEQKAEKAEMQKAFDEMVKDVSDLIQKPAKTQAEKEASIDSFVRLTRERQDNIADYSKVFDMAEKTLKERFAGNPQAISNLNSIKKAFQNGYSNKRLTNVIEETMKKIEVDVKDLVKKSAIDKSNAKSILVSNIRHHFRNSGVDESTVEKIIADVSAQFDKRLEAAKWRYLNGKVAPRKKTRPSKAAVSELVELINTGAYWDRNIPEEIKDLLAMFADKKFAKAVDEAVKQTNLDLQKIMKQSGNEKTIAKEKLVDTFSDNLRIHGVNEAGIEFFKESVEALFDSKLEKAAKKHLMQRFAPKGKPVRKTMIEDVMELIHMGAYDDADIVNLMRAKNGVNVLTPQQAKQIMDYMEVYEKNPGTREAEEALAKANKIIANLEGSDFGDKFRSVQRVAMLFNPKTWFSRNAGGNILLGAAENIKDIPASVIDRLVALKTGERTTTGITPTKLKEQGKGLAHGTKEQLLDIKHGVDTAHARTKYEMPNKDVWKNKPMQKLDTLIGQLLQLGDRPFYEGAYRARKAELESLVKKGKSKLTAEEIEEQAKYFALDRVFQADTSIAKTASKMREALNDFADNGILGNIVLPFTQTPSNIISKLIDYSPAGLLKAVKELSKTRKGTFNQKVFVDTLGRTFTGAGVIMLGYALANKNLMTVDLYAQSGREQQVQKAYEKQGLQSYAISLDDETSFTIDWANPIGSLLILGAEAYYGSANQEDLVTALYGGGIAAVDSVFNQSFLQGLQTLFSSRDGSISEGMGDTLLSATTQPLPSVIQQLTRIVDPVKRETYDESPFKKQLNVLMSKTPYLSTKLPEKKDVTGQTVEQFQGRSTSSKIFEAYLNPANISQRQYNRVNDEAVRVYEATGLQSALLKIGDKSFSYDGAQYTLKNAEELSRFQEVQGKYAYEELSKVMDSSSYRKQSDSEKAETIHKITLEAKDKAAEDYLIKNKGYTQTELDFNKLSDSKREKYQNTNLTKRAYIEAINTANTYNADGKGNLKQDEFKQYVSENGVSSSTARQLWEAYGWAASKNPY